MTFVIDTTVRMSLIILIALAGMVLVRRRSAAVRHWLLAVAIACGAATPLLQLALPSWHIGVAAFSPAAPPQRQTAHVDTAIVFQNAQTAGNAALSGPPSTSMGRGSSMLLWLWLAGAGLSLSMLGVGLARLSLVAGSARRIDRGRWAEIAADIQDAIGLRRPVTVLQSDHPTLLVTWGVARPRIILPAGAVEWPADRARIVLQHELAHVRRGDWTAQITAEVLRAVYWFNPLLWIACRRLREESERACDDAVLSGGVDPADYASHLLDLARILHAMRRAPRPALAMARSSSLEGRVCAMLNARINRRPLTYVTRVAIAVALAALTLPIAVASQTRFSTFSGTVVDQTNAFLPDTTLVLTNTSTRAKYEVRTDPVGHFEFVGLPAGDYQLEVRQAGFATLTEAVAMTGRDVNRTLQLQVGSLQETIRVTGAPAVPRDPDQQVRTERARRRAEEMRQRASAKCSAGSSTEAVGGNLLVPLKLIDVRPDYPEHLKSAGIGGVVTLEAVIDTDGTVRDVRVVSSPHPELERAAIDAVRQWEFSTTYLNCTPIEVRMQVTANFVPAPPPPPPPPVRD